MSSTTVRLISLTLRRFISSSSCLLGWCRRNIAEYPVIFSQFHCSLIQSLFGDDSPTETANNTIDVQITGYKATGKKSAIKRRLTRNNTVNSTDNFMCQLCNNPVTTPTKLSGCCHYVDIHCMLQHTALKCERCAILTTTPPIMVLHPNVTDRIPNIFEMSINDRDSYQASLRINSANIAHIRCNYDGVYTLYVTNLDIVQIQVFQNNMNARQHSYTWIHM